MALVLQREVGETIVVRLSEVEAVGGVLEITVVRVGGRRVKLAFDAPREQVAIARKEVDRDAA